MTPDPRFICFVVGPDRRFIYVFENVVHGSFPIVEVQKAHVVYTDIRDLDGTWERFRRGRVEVKNGWGRDVGFFDLW